VSGLSLDAKARGEALGARARAQLVFPRHPAPIGFAEPPIVALVDLEEGIRLVSNLVEVTPDAIAPGMPVEVIFAPTAGGKAVPVFRPVR
jgi:uncharacterized OB-fold protein